MAMSLSVQIQKLLEPIRTSIRMILSRAIVNVVNDTTKMQLMQIEALSKEVKDDVERIQNYGFTSCPKPGAEAFVGFINGNKDQGVIIAVDDSRFRLKGLEAGEVAVYNFAGSSVILKKDGSIVLNSDKIKLGDEGLLPLDGVVTGRSLCAFTGTPHPDKSSKILASKA
jgi:phage baseplate assembly protein V